MSAQDDQEIRGLVDAFVEGWNAADGAACARPFAADAEFVNIMGLRARGRELIGRGHAEILSTIFRGTRMSATVESIRFLRPDVATVEATLKLQTDDGRPFTLGRYPGYSSAGLVATKEGNTWSIAVFRNMIPFERPAAGPLEQTMMGAHPKQGPRST